MMPGYYAFLDRGEKNDWAGGFVCSSDDMTDAVRFARSCLQHVADNPDAGRWHIVVHSLTQREPVRLSYPFLTREQMKLREGAAFPAAPLEETDESDTTERTTANPRWSNQ